MIESTDQLGRVVRLARLPQRIVSLVPSQTELLFDLGAGDRVVGVTRYCIHPAAGVRDVARVGGTKKFRFDVIDQLAPDLIIGNKEENYEAGIERLTATCPVWMSDVVDIDDALAMIGGIGHLTGTGPAAARIGAGIRAGFATLARDLAGAPPVPAAYLIWRRPWMVVGRGSFIDEMLRAAGFRNVFGERPRYPEVDDTDISRCGAKMLMLSSEPFPFREEHLHEVRALAPGADVRIVDGEMFSWYGSRLLRSPAYLRQLRTV